jgi:cytochrome P450
MPVAFDPFSSAHRDDPYPKYRELRDHAPVHFSPEANVWCVSRYDDVQQVLKSPEVFSSRAMFTMLMNGGNEEPPRLTPYLLGFLVRMALRTRSNPLGFATARTLIADDGERHTGMRAIVNRGFSPRRIAAWEKRARELVAECMAKLDSGAPFDLVHDLAIPLPVTLIAEMLGVETERLADFKRWSDVVVE